MKELKIKIEVISSEGIITDKKETSVNVGQFAPDSIRKDRILLEIGECLYYVDSDGFIKDQVFNANTGQVAKYPRNKNNIECCTICNTTEGKNVSNSEKSLL
jgi:hypothetical protein